MAVKGLKSSGVQLLNAVRTSIIANNGLEYANRIPVATQENLKDMGKAILDYQPAKNAFLDNLINRIGLVVIRNRLYKNKLAIFKKGFLELGDSIEELYVDIARAVHYTPEAPEDNLCDVFEQFKPKVVSAFHRINRQDTYPITINEEMLKKAFTGWANFDSFVAAIFNSLYNAAEYDEYVLFKQLLGASAKNAYKRQVTIPTDKASAEDFTIALRSAGLTLEYMSRAYNELGVATHTPLDKQILILRSDIVPQLDVRVIANAFNASFAEPLNNRIIVTDDFGEGNSSVIAMIVDEDWSMIYDTMYRTDSQYNARHTYWNYFLHIQSILSASPFANVYVFTTKTVTPAINSVEVKPNTLTMAKGTSYQFEAVVDYTGDIDTSVTFSVSGASAVASGTKIDPTSGKLTVDSAETNTTLTVKATSTANSGKTGTATVTLTDGN